MQWGEHPFLANLVLTCLQPCCASGNPDCLRSGSSAWLSNGLMRHPFLRIHAVLRIRFEVGASRRRKRVMEWNGSERASSSQSQESSLLDLPADINPESFLLKSNPEEDEAFDLTLPAVDTESIGQFFPGPAAKANITLWPCLYERREPTSCENTERTEVPEQRGEGESTLRKSLDTFYSTLCQKKPSGRSPIYESTSRCLSLKAADLAGKEAMKFTVKNLQIAQMVLNREENKIFPQPPSNHFCLLTPVSAVANSEKGKAIPGLSDDVFQFLLKQNVLK